MKVLLAEDTKDLNRVLCVALSREGFEVDSAMDGIQALELATHNAYDLMILDIMMPGMTGLEVLRTVRMTDNVTPVLFLTAKSEVEDRVQGLDAGADDYLSKPFSIRELLARARAMTRRKGVFSEKLTHFADFSLDEQQLELSCENAVRLSAKEFELLRLLMANAGQVLTSEYLANRVWEPGKADRDTVVLYISYLRRKLEAVASKAIITGEPTEGFKLEEA